MRYLLAEVKRSWSFAEDSWAGVWVVPWSAFAAGIEFPVERDHKFLRCNLVAPTFRGACLFRHRWARLLVFPRAVHAEIGSEQQQGQGCALCPMRPSAAG